MNNLSAQKCVPCEGGTPPLIGKQVEKLLLQISKKWSLGEKEISASFEFKDFVEAMRFVNKVAEIAEVEGHHPDIKINYNKVTLRLSTHAIGGLSINDFVLAAKIDELGKWGIG